MRSARTIGAVRIVSLLPSATEILFDLGLGDDIVGVTFECDFPEAARTKRIVSTSALPEGLSPAEIDTVVKARMAAGEDLYRLDRGAFADIDPELVVARPGPRVVDGVETIASVLHPERCGPPAPDVARRMY